MTTSTSLYVVVPSPGPSDADLLGTLASLLAAMPGERVEPPLSRLVEYVCSASCVTTDWRARARDLELALAGYLNEWHVLPSGRVSPTGLDAWAADTPIAFLRAALAACARCQRAAGGDVR